MKYGTSHLRRWLASIQGKLIIASLLLSLIPTAIAAELTVRLVLGVMDSDVEAFLHETSILFLGNFQETQQEGAALSHYLYEEHQQRYPGKAINQVDPSFMRLVETLGYGVVVIYDAEDKHIVYSNYPVRRFELLPSGAGNNLYSLQLPNRTTVMSGGSYAYQAEGHSHVILVGNWLDENFIENLKSVTSIDLRLYYQRDGQFQMIYSSRSEAAAGTRLPDEVVQALKAGHSSYYDSEAEDGRFRVEYMPVRNAKGEMIGIMSSGMRSTELPKIGDLPVNTILMVFLSGGFLTALTGMFISRRLSRPLRALAKGVSSIIDGHYGHRVAVQGDDEVAELAQAFNHMSERLGQLRSLEAELRRKDRLSALGEVAMGIAHEVRNPLGTIKTSAELVRKREGLAPGDVKLLGYVVDEVRRIDSLITEFLSFARPTAPVLRRLPLSAVAKRVADFCEPELSSHKISLSVEDQSDGVMVDGDEDHLFQAALNLVLNAIDAMEGGGTLTISVWRDGAWAKISFADTGPGIPSDMQEKIFDPFFTTKPRGTGLGLAKVFAVMENHQGGVDLNSEAGQGSCFILMLPAAD
ncbi:MAG TPA: ATP-binding protein [Candidatus Sulfotelmatobacter sp.]|jgi:signal transduction histidine kinase|nr:ATP-binding protein [Candidatus Sulfotelmatobacter sp.]